MFTLSFRCFAPLPLRSNISLRVCHFLPPVSEGRIGTAESYSDTLSVCWLCEPGQWGWPTSRLCTVDCHSRSRQLAKFNPPPIQICHFLMGAGLLAFGSHNYDRFLNNLVSHHSLKMNLFSSICLETVAEILILLKNGGGIPPRAEFKVIKYHDIRSFYC